MKKIAITGTIASGKTTFTSLLKRRRLPVFNSDQYSRICLQKIHPAYRQIVEAFGDGILDEFGEIDRRKLADVIFSDNQKRLQLNAITHPYIIQGMNQFMERHMNDRFAFAEVPLLYDAGLEDMFDYVIVVTCEDETAISRMMEDRAYSKAEAVSRLKSQMDRSRQIERADYVFHNDGSIKDLDHELSRWMSSMRQK